MKRFVGLLFAALSILDVYAQDLRQDTMRNKVLDKLQLNFLIDAYYGFDFSRKEVGFRQPYYYNSNRHNEFAMNMAMLDAQYTAERVRGRVALGTGTYFDANYAAEPQGFRNIFEASVGIKLSKTKDLWLDAGVLPSPYGFEGAISLDQLTYTRSFSAENSPYYLTGARLDLPLGDKWDLKLFVINGWQNIVETNHSKSFGTQLQYKPQEGVLLNWSTYAGDERSAQGSTYPGSSFAANPHARNRYFSDLYAYWAASDKLELLALFDIGQQQYNADSVGYASATWSTANAIARYKLTQEWAVAGRVEYFSDPRSVIIAAQNPGLTGFTVYGGSLGIDYCPAGNVRLRLEHRTILSAENQFMDANGEPTKLNHYITMSLSARF